MTTERLFLNQGIRQAVRAEKRRAKSRKRPEQVLCDLLNRLNSQQRQVIALRLR